MSNVTNAMREHHQELLHFVTTQAELLANDHSNADPVALTAFLKTELLPHAAGEERALYPAVEPLIVAEGQATATMRVDHAVIGDYVRLIDELTRAYVSADPSARQMLRVRLARSASQLEAIFRLHMRKEEDVYLPLIERFLLPDEQQRLLNDLHAVPDETAVGATALDVREVPPPQRHVLIFQTFEALTPGGTFLLINDHDPKPLYYQFKFERDGQFTWDYEEEGPRVWQVRIGKVAVHSVV